jgi:Fur family transcriptional regulator, ferric uptake regulator
LLDPSLANSCISINDAKSKCLEKLKRAKIRMSKQRLELVDLLFTGSFTCTKELYYEALSNNPDLGMSTVYRFLKVLSDIGVIAKNKVLDIGCNNCEFRLASLKDNNGRDVVAEGLNLHELLRLGLIVKGVIKSDEKIDVKMIDDSVHISIQN